MNWGTRQDVDVTALAVQGDLIGFDGLRVASADEGRGDTTGRARGVARTEERTAAWSGPSLPAGGRSGGVEQLTPSVF